MMSRGNDDDMDSDDDDDDVKPEYRYTQARIECPECRTMNIKGLTFCKVCDKD